MNKSDKPRVIKDYDKLDEEIKEQIKLVYPNGYSHHLIKFTNKDGKIVSALPFETDEKYYLVRMTVAEAIEIVEQDDDFDDKGMLKEGSREEYEEKYSDLDYLPDSGGSEDVEVDEKDDGPDEIDYDDDDDMDDVDDFDDDDVEDEK